MTVGPFVVARCVDNRLRVGSEQIANLYEFLVRARQALRLEVADVHQKREVLTFRLLQKAAKLCLLVG